MTDEIAIAVTEARRRMWWRRALIAIIAPPLLYAIAVVVLMLIPVNTDFREDANGVEILVWSNGVHTDVVMPVNDSGASWKSVFPASHDEAARQEESHVAVGWGSREFYLETPTWSELKFSTALRAATGRGGSLLHVTWLDAPPANGAECRRVRVSRDAYGRLAAFIKNSAVMNGEGRAVAVSGSGYGGSDVFCESPGRYHAITTCNVWTGRALAAAGVKVSAWTPFASGVFFYLPESEC